jgi:hypothetical protein
MLRLVVHGRGNSVDLAARTELFATSAAATPFAALRQPAVGLEPTPPQTNALATDHSSRWQIGYPGIVVTGWVHAAAHQIPEHQWRNDYHWVEDLGSTAIPPRDWPSEFRTVR